jgi:fructosamine-3-kinase
MPAERLAPAATSGGAGRAMTAPSDWLGRLEHAFGPVGPSRQLGSNVWLLEAGGRRLVAKHSVGALDEASGLTSLGEISGAPPVPEVVLAESDLLVTTAVDQAPRTAGHEEILGRRLAALHDAPFPHWGGGSSWIGACPVDPTHWPDGASFYGARLTRLAKRCGLERSVAPVVGRLGELLPPSGPSLVHGDLWWGNVLFGTDGRPWLIDPSVHGGHPEEDLAMLALFGAVPDRLLHSYREVHPLSPGWAERVHLFQLYPLLVHTVLFDGAYRAQTERVAQQFA